MKNLIVLAMVAAALTIINGCQKDELVSQLADEQLQEAVKPDVYLENGYLAFKNMEAVDSVNQMLGKMTPQEIEAWEKRMDFKSAKTFFEPIFNEAEKATTVEDILAFKEKYKETLKWNENDPTDYSFDYPFYYTNFVSLINKDVILKIVISLFKYNKENRITILDGDITKLETALNLKNNSKNILILNEKNNLKSVNTLIGLTNFDGQYGNDGSPDDDWCNWSSSRKMKTGLQFEDFIYGSYYGGYDGAYKIYLWQRAQKKVLGIWKNYSVRYRYGSMVYKENNIIKATYGIVTTPSTQSTLFEVYSTVVYTGLINPPQINVPYPMYFACITTNEDFGYYPFGVVYNN
jgi:hypothetical protein